MVSCEYGRDHGLWSATHSHYLIYLKLTSKKALFVVALLVTLHFLLSPCVCSVVGAFGMASLLCCALCRCGRTFVVNELSERDMVQSNDDSVLQNKKTDVKVRT